MKKIIVLGAGTAGLISALVLKSTFPKYKISVIESGAIGIIGVGEGSTEHWKTFTDYCGINTNRLIRETDGALKKGIKFENWNGDGKSYFHSLSPPFFDEFTDYGQRLNFTKTMIFKGIPTQDILVDTNYIQQQGGIQSTNQYHFNTFKLNKFLHDVCKEKGIDFTDAPISDVSFLPNGDVSKLIDEAGNDYIADIFIDSTGFKRVISSKQGAKWVSYKKYLPMNHALAFPTEDISDLKPYTLSRALSSGWNWRISTQSRYGNGYVFCDEFIDSTKAHEEIQSFYTEEVKVAKDIKFEAGRVDKFWINNCISVGLSASFVEPLEASSIGNSIIQAFGIAKMLPLWELDRKYAEKYNKDFIRCFDNIVDFVQLHYMTKRNDTLFWRTLPEMMTKTDFIKEHLEIFKKTLPNQSLFMAEYNMFQAPNWAQVMNGLELLDKNYISKKLMDVSGENVLMDSFTRYNHYLTDTEKGSYIDHKVLLEQNRIVVKLDRQ
jgi:tryptophan halogenase